MSPVESPGPVCSSSEQLELLLDGTSAFPREANSDMQPGQLFWVHWYVWQQVAHGGTRGQAVSDTIQTRTDSGAARSCLGTEEELLSALVVWLSRSCAWPQSTAAGTSSEKECAAFWLVGEAMWGVGRQNWLGADSQSGFAWCNAKRDRSNRRVSYWHNNLTDAAAESINLHRPPPFWEAWQGLQSALHFHRQLHLAILQVLLKTSRLAVAEQQKASAMWVVEPQAVELPSPPVTWAIPKSIIKRYGEYNLQMLHEWWSA